MADLENVYRIPYSDKDPSESDVVSLVDLGATGDNSIGLGFGRILMVNTLGAGATSVNGFIDEQARVIPNDLATQGAADEVWLWYRENVRGYLDPVTGLHSVNPLAGGAEYSIIDFSSSLLPAETGLVGGTPPVGPVALSVADFAPQTLGSSWMELTSLTPLSNANGYYFVPSGRELVFVKGTGAVSISCENTVANISGIVPAVPPDVSLVADEWTVLGPFGDPKRPGLVTADNYVEIGVTGVSHEAYAVKF